MALLLQGLSPAQDLRGAEQHLLQGRADQAAGELHALLARNNTNGAAHLLLCRVYLSTLHGAEAAAECRAALNNGLSQNAAAQDWSGRAFGMEAGHAGPVAGLKLARQVREAFGTAHQLDPQSPEAANDLGEYYVQAPFIVGGGIDKALSLADSIAPRLPEIAQRLRALAAEKRSNLNESEQDFLKATAVSGNPGAFVDLATFYNRKGDPSRAAAAARRAIQADHALDANLVEAAGALDDAHQPAQAVAALRSYIDHGRLSDQAPLFRAHTMLGKLYARQGDGPGARKEYAAALALASDYAPARKGLDSL